MILTADGCQDGTVVTAPSCCPPPLCGNDLCCTFVAFMNQLPSGPLWDFWKAAAISYFQTGGDPKQCPLLANPRCPSLVLHAIYAVLKLKALVHDALWPAFRESNPVTVVTTIDDHLARLQWEDCYRQHCRSVLLGELTPYEVNTPCGPLFCPPEFSPELEAAVKRAIAIALTRAQMGVIKNLCGLNWVIEPLGAEIVPVTPQLANPVPDPLDPCDSACPNGIRFMVQPTQDWLPGLGSGDVCDTQVPPIHIQAYVDRGCERGAGLPDRVWPAVLAAECIVRSMLPPMCPSNITHNC